MISKRIATLLAAVAVAGASPAFSQATAAPAPAAETACQGSAQADFRDPVSQGHARDIVGVTGEHREALSRH